MSTAQALEVGSRHDLRAGISPDAPDEDEFEGRGRRVWLGAIPTRPASRYDGPGVRVMLFMSGCLLRCQYCHNPDTWHLKDGTRVGRSRCSAGSATSRRRCAPWAAASRSPAASRWCSSASPGACSPAPRGWGCTRRSTRRASSATAPTTTTCRNVDLVLLDIKSGDPETYRRVTGRELAPTLRFAERLAAMAKPVWVRFVLVPGADRRSREYRRLARFVAPMKNVEWVEVLPFHQMGAFKWKALGLDYKLADTPPPTPRAGEPGLGQFRAAGCQRAD